MNRLLDIIIPEYNCKEEDIERLLQSVSYQANVDFNEIGIIIVSDKSKNELNSELFNNYPNLNIEYYKKNVNEGPGLTRQYGLDNSKAEYVTFVDSDDILHGPNALSIVIENLKKYKMDMLYTDYFRYDPYIDSIKIMTYEDLLCLHGVFFKRNTLVEGNYRFNNKIRMYEDTYFMLITSKTLKPKYLNIPTYVWFFNKDGLTAKGNVGTKMIQKRLDEFLIANIDAVRFVASKNVDVKEYFKKTFIYLTIVTKSDLFIEIDVSKEERLLCDFYNEFGNDCIIDDNDDSDIIKLSIDQAKHDYGINNIIMTPNEFLKKMNL